MSPTTLNIKTTSRGSRVFLVKIVTAVINIPACIFFLTFLFDLFAGKQQSFSTLPALMGLLFLSSMTMHMFLGMQTVMGDYVHHARLLVVLKTGNVLYCGLMFILGCVGIFGLWSGVNA